MVFIDGVVKSGGTNFDSNEDIVPQVPVGPNLDKTGVDIKYDRLDLKLNHPEQYVAELRDTLNGKT